MAHARDLAPDDAGIHFFFALTCNEMRLPVEARKSIEKALALAPENPYYNYAMGVMLLQWAEKDGAVPFLKRYVSAQPSDPRGHLALAAAYFGTSHNDDARRELAGIMGTSQARAGSQYLLGRIAAQEGDVTGAIAHFKQVVTLEPNSSDAHAQLADLLFGKEDLEGARRETAASLALDPDNYAANRTLLRLYRIAKDPRLKSQTERLKTLAGIRAPGQGEVHQAKIEFTTSPAISVSRIAPRSRIEIRFRTAVLVSVSLAIMTR